MTSLAQLLKALPFVRRARLARVRRRAEGDGPPDWAPILAASGARWAEAQAKTAGPRVLIATNVGLHFGAARFDSLLAVALTLRGARVDVLLCDGALPACMNADASWYPDLRRYAERGPQADFCAFCFAPAAAVWETLGILPIRLSSLLEAGDREAARDARKNAALHRARDPALEDALAGALRFFARSTLPPGPGPQAVLGAFAEAAELAGRGAARLLARERYDAVVLHHGIYVPQGPMLAAARRAGTRVVTWNPGYRSGTFVLSHGDTYHRAMISEAPERWEGLDLGPAREAALMRYLESRRRGTRDWIVFNRATRFDGPVYLQQRGLDPGKPTYLAATNVAWDAQLHYPANCFATMREWLIATVAWFAARRDRQLVIRVHPAEATGHLPSREPVEAMLKQAFPDWPANVVVVAPTDTVSTYALVEATQASLIYATKLGIEIAATGKPVVVAGEAWIRGKGFSWDATDPADYARLLETLGAMTMSAEAVTRARRYAWHYFFRRMIPVPAMGPDQGWPPYRVAATSLAELEPGRDPGLDAIAAGILAGAPFELPDAAVRP